MDGDLSDASLVEELDAADAEAAAEAAAAGVDDSQGDAGRRRGGLADRVARAKARKARNGRAAFYKKEHARMQKAAQETNETLTAIIAEKDVMIASLQARIEEARRQRDRERTEASALRERAVEEAYEENRAATAKLRQALTDLQRAPAANLHGAQVNVHALERAEDLERRLIDAQRGAERAKSEANLVREAMAAERSAKDEAIFRAEQAQEEVRKLQQLVDANIAPREGRPKDQLKRILALRDRKIKKLSKAFKALNEEFINAEKAHAKEMEHLRQKAAMHSAMAAAQASGEGGSGAKGGALEGVAAQQKVDKLEKLAGKLEHSVKATKAQLRRAVAAEQKARHQQEALSRDLDRMATTSAQHEAAARSSADALRRCQRQLDEARQELRDAKRSGRRGERTEEGASAAELKSLRNKIKVLEAQNAAFQAAAAHAQQTAARSALVAESSSSKSGASPPRPPSGGATSAAVRKAWEDNKRLQRRAELLARRLAEKSAEVDAARAEAGAAKEATARAEKEVKSLGAKLRRQARKQAVCWGRANAHVQPNFAKQAV